MKALAILLVLCCTSCVGSWMPEVYIDHGNMERYLQATETAVKASDLDGNGITEGRTESTAFWNNALSAAATFVAPPPAGADPESPER